jgi:hypothetical protein
MQLRYWLGAGHGVFAGRFPLRRLLSGTRSTSLLALLQLLELSLVLQ